MPIHKLKKIITLDIDGTVYEMARFNYTLRTMIARRLIHHNQELPLTGLYSIMKFHYCAKQARHNPTVENMNRFVNQSQLAYESLNAWYGSCLRAIGSRPGVTHFIDTMRSLDVKIVGLTDFICGYKIDSLNLTSYFDDIVEGESIPCLKPSPKLFQELIAKYNVVPEQILHIGDRVDTDGACAQVMGIDCLIIGKHFNHFDDLTEKLLGKGRYETT